MPFASRILSQSDVIAIQNSLVLSGILPPKFKFSVAACHVFCYDPFVLR